MHISVMMARRQVATMLPRGLTWPYDCTRRCNELVPVATGPAVADELTRNLREPFKSSLRGRY